jgi:hypothetical protein
VHDEHLEPAFRIRAFVQLAEARTHGPIPGAGLRLRTPLPGIESPRIGNRYAKRLVRNFAGVRRLRFRWSAWVRPKEAIMGPETPRRPAPSNPGPGDVPPVNPSPEEPAPADPKPIPTRPIPLQPEIGVRGGR